MCVRKVARKINRNGDAIFINDNWREDCMIDIQAVANFPQSLILPPRSATSFMAASGKMRFK
jgi:hypothetical protein